MRHIAPPLKHQRWKLERKSRERRDTRAFEDLANRRFPGTVALPGAYNLLGRFAVFGAVARAPILSAIILLEMTGNYKINLPLMPTTGVAMSLLMEL
jgi:H+/Cl- antiporter ClcA